jgi:hypothetical protein
MKTDVKESKLTQLLSTDDNYIAFSSNQHEFIKYTDNRMYMPSSITDVIENDHNNALRIINDKKDLFIAEVKGYIPKEFYNEFINFPPIFRNIDIDLKPEVIGDYMYNYMKSNNMKTEVKERKLKQLLSTDDNYISFSSYYLWYLIDKFHFKITDVKTLIVFSKHTAFNPFVNHFMNLRQQAIIDKNTGLGEFCKLILNGSYGYDAMNTENYSKSYIQSTSRAACSILSNKFINTRELSENVHQVMMHNSTYRCDTCLQEAFFTLDNAKYWYLTFIYEFMYKCLDMSKIHFIEGDTDSMYWAIAGDPNENYKQGFKYVIKDYSFYNQNVFKFLPYNFYCDDSYRPKFENRRDEVAHEKKLLGFALEKEGDNMIALGPKCYTTWNNTSDQNKASGKITAMRCKGVSLNQNKEINTNSYREVAEKNKIVTGINSNLQLKKNEMVRIEMMKTALSGRHTKMYCYEDGICAVLIKGCKYE